MDSNYGLVCPCEIAGNMITFRNSKDQLCLFEVVDDISKLMVNWP